MANGWNGSRNANLPARTPYKAMPIKGVKPAKRCILLSIICVSVIIALWWVVVQRTEEHNKVTAKDPKEFIPIKQSKPTPPPKIKEQPISKTATSKKPINTYMGRIIVSETSVTNGSIVVTTRISDKGEVLKAVRNIEPPAIFDNASDELISMTIMAKRSASMPPLPPPSPNADEEFMLSLRNPIIIQESDSDEVRETKQAVIEARMVIKDELDKGGHFNDILRQQRDFHNDAVELRTEASSVYRNLIKEGELEMAEEYRKKANILLEQNGVDALTERTVPANKK